MLRADLKIIAEWIRPGSRVLDLGCGSGKLLAYLQEHHGVTGYGLEIDPDKIVQCIKRGVNVIHADLDDENGLTYFDNNSFDIVIMTQALQVVRRPDFLLEEMLRIGNQGIVTFPNFGYWRTRLALARGRMPMTKHLPTAWYNTENIHLCTVEDFEALCAEKGFSIRQRMVMSSHHSSNTGTRLLPNLLGEVALYRFRKAG